MACVVRAMLAVRERALRAPESHEMPHRPASGGPVNQLN